MKILFYIILCLFFSWTNLIAQKHDNIWMFGNTLERNHPDHTGLSILEFQEDSIWIDVERERSNFKFDITNISICDEDGKLLFYSNGLDIMNANHEIMENGGEIKVLISDYGGDIVPQGMLALPIPERDSMYSLIHVYEEDFFDESEYIYTTAAEIWYSEIDIKQNNGLGAVVIKNKLILQDTLDIGKITATRHGNGRDWWIVLSEGCFERTCQQNGYYRLLLTPDGIVQIDYQQIGSPTATGLGQAHFTPDGSKYVISHSIENGKPNEVDIYDFNRCTGLLSNHRKVKTAILDWDADPSDFGSGLAISQNSRFAYLVLGNRIIQIDLLAKDVQASIEIVEQYDRVWDPLPTNFLFAQLAPNGKIYICTGNGSKYLHVIHKPNEKGEACNVEQRGVVLPYQNSFSIPNFPNYRLYDLPNSPCDTLGIGQEEPEPDTTTITLIDIYPNPAKDYLTIEKVNIEQATLKVFSATAQLLIEQEITESISTLDISYLPAGIYFCHIQTNDHKIYIEKIIISR